MVICIQLLREPFKNVVEVRPKLDKIETNSQFAQIISPNEVIALVTLNFKMGNVEGLMNVCIPYLSLEPIIDKLNTKYWFSSMQHANDEFYREFIERQIAAAKIPLRAVLGKATISINDFIELQKGDIIKLDTRLDDEIKLTVGNLDKFTGKPGVYNGHAAFRIASVMKEEE